MKNKIIFANMLLILFLFNYSIVKNEQHKEEGVTVYFELAPRDPRSLLQGDYMALNYEIIHDITKACLEWEKQGRHVPSQVQAYIQIDEKKIGNFVSLKIDGAEHGKSEILLPFKFHENKVILSLSKSYFFEEGQAKTFEKAKYGVFKYAHEKLLLVHLADENRKILK